MHGFYARKLGSLGCQIVFVIGELEDIDDLFLCILIKKSYNETKNVFLSVYLFYSKPFGVQRFQVLSRGYS